MPNSFVADRLMYAVSKVMQQARLFYSRASSDYDEDRLWYELVACILGSQVPFELAQAAASHLNEEGLLDFQRHDMSYCAREQSISAALSKPIFPPITKSGVGRKYRYPNTKALQIRKTAEAIYKSGLTLGGILHSCDNPREGRLRIISVANGVGPKQASLFLRNVSYANELAILDVHVLDFMKMVGLIHNSDSTPSGLHQYERMEACLREYAEEDDLEFASLDTAIWVVMRTYKKEFLA